MKPKSIPTDDLSKLIQPDEVPIFADKSLLGPIKPSDDHLSFAGHAVEATVTGSVKGTAYMIRGGDTKSPIKIDAYRLVPDNSLDTTKIEEVPKKSFEHHHPGTRLPEFLEKSAPPSLLKLISRTVASILGIKNDE